MSTVVFDMSMSLDGYVTATGTTPEEPTGKGGERLTEWAMGGDPASNELLAAGAAETGAIIAGRRTYDTSLPWWGANGPTGAARMPLIVVTHRAPADVAEGGVYHFADGIDSALRQARELAGGKNVAVMGGADVGVQFLKAGLVDEIGIHLVPVLFGGGTRLFELLEDEHVQLEVISVVNTPPATHLRYRVMR